MGISYESDGIDEAVEGQLRMFVTAGAQLGEQLAREFESRLEAEKTTALAELDKVHEA